jgi:tripeptide aminopeptidase
MTRTKAAPPSSKTVAKSPKASTKKSSTKTPSPKADTFLPFNKQRALEMVLELMAIRGGSGQEGAVAGYIREKLIAAGVPEAELRHDNAHTKTPIKGEVGNLVLQLPGTVRGPRRLLMAHMDTVPICIGSKPKRSGNFVRSADPATGLGADDRAGVAVVLATVLEILERKLPHPPLTLLWVIQEEIGLHGARHVQKGMLGKPTLAFNWDGGAAEKITIGATGGYRLQIEIEGLAAHAGGAPEQGISAIAIAALAIAQLVREGWHGLIEKDGKRGTSNVGVIHGGAATNVVTDLVQIKAEARSHDPAFRKKIVSIIEKAFKDAAGQVKSAAGKCGRVRFSGQLDYEAFKLSVDEPSVIAAQGAVRALGLEPELAVSNGGLDANWMSAHGIPTVTLGCGQMQIHTTSETLDIQAFEKACQIALRLATAIE